MSHRQEWRLCGHRIRRIVAVYRDSEKFSAINSSSGPFPLPFDPVGDDINELIESHRDQFPMNEHLVSFDPPTHTAHAPCWPASSRRSA